MSEFMKDREADLKDGAPTVGTEAEVAVESMEPEVAKAVLGVLLTLADHKYVLGRRYSEWATSGPTLEASVAAASMTTDEMGHARSLYPLLKKFPDAPAGLKREADRTEFFHVSFLDGSLERWTDFIAVAALFDRALTVLLEALRESSWAPFRHRAAKMLQEERYHAMYADGWLETLAAEPGPRAELKDAMNRIWTETLAWFGPDDDPVFGVAAREGILAADGPTLRGRFVERVRASVSPIAGLAFPADAPLPWDRWDAGRRRLRG